jgi:hypothetical protein
VDRRRAQVTVIGTVTVDQTHRLPLALAAAAGGD